MNEAVLAKSPVQKRICWRAVQWMSAGSEWLGPFAAPLLIAAIVMAAFTVLRMAMLLTFSEPTSLDVVSFSQVLWVGMRFDLLVALCFVLWQSAHIAAVPHRGESTVHNRLFEFEWLVAWLALPLLCIVEWLFFMEFQSRLNYVAFEYLVYPTEVCCNIWESYAVVPYALAAAAVGAVIYWQSRRPLLRLINRPMSTGRRWTMFGGMIAAIGGLWSTTSMESRHISVDRVAMECAGNGLYSFVYYAWTCRFDFDANYMCVSQPDAVARVRKQVVRINHRLCPESANPVDRIVVTNSPRQNWNVVLILEESFGSDFVGVLGDDRGLTPEFDRLSREGLLFDQFYATGNRTARALEAVLTSMPPIPTESILKRDHSGRVFTLAHVLAQRGYERLFMTGGRGLFDGVRSFMTSNGFNHFREQPDYEDPLFTNAWGISDEDLFREALTEFDNLHDTGKPFFATLLTVSNHRPYTFPAGRIPSDAQNRENAVRYADWALGNFFREAKNHAFYDNTLFVVMGDHGARVYGSQYFPVMSYRVPVLIISPDGSGAGSRCNTLACSLDIAPTVMGQLGGDYRSVFFGRNVVRLDPAEGRAVMQHNHDVALLNADHHMTVLGFNHAISGFRLNPETFALEETQLPDSDSSQNTAALFQMAFQLYYTDLWFTGRPVSEDEQQRMVRSIAQRSVPAGERGMSIPRARLDGFMQTDRGVHAIR